ncbi:hypothetical protein HD806DRAFT_515914 [Xylariaceae sp. AK1471]|nr:hypothetical protein HD806DRAFT_515914 [Xylariaceae sp. AK1471]
MAYSSPRRHMRPTSLALVLVVSLTGYPLQTCEAAVMETTSPNPWPTDTTYTLPSTQQTVISTVGAPPGDCLLSAYIVFGDPGYHGLNCGREEWTTTTSRTLTVDCEGCDKVTVTQAHGGCPMGGSHGPPVLQTTPYYRYAYECATITNTVSPPKPTS